MITPTFHFSILEQFVDVFNSCGHKLCEKLEKEVGKDSFDFYTYSTKCTLDIICGTFIRIITILGTIFLQVIATIFNQSKQ